MARVIGQSMLVVSFLLFGAAAQAATLQYQAYLDGLQEVAPVATPGYGSALLTLNDVTGDWSLTGTFNALIGTSNNAHIHGPAPVGTNGAAIVALTYTIGVTDGTLSGAGTFTVPQMADLANGLYYVNVHSTYKVGGEIRGQFSAVPEPTIGLLLACGGVGWVAIARRRARAGR